MFAFKSEKRKGKKLAEVNIYVCSFAYSTTPNDETENKLNLLTTSNSEFSSRLVWPGKQFL